ncbi:hypothetical protein MLD38_035392 [Melastoma candidum]|uniref:Uncharacterized protein n=1 Tax=Melastoma candidum TaxID=119954 RepID=A0ACB9LG19_9MYRT|nr:hypothetical protein MLD38_035392 [Melastoma candidum]
MLQLLMAPEQPPAEDHMHLSFLGKIRRIPKYPLNNRLTQSRQSVQQSLGRLRRGISAFMWEYHHEQYPPGPQSFDHGGHLNGDGESIGSQQNGSSPQSKLRISKRR